MTDIGKANLWFVLKCRSSPVVILRPFRNGSEPKHSQTIIYVRFDRADAIESLLVDGKYTYHGIHLECPLGSLGGRHLPSFKPTLHMRVTRAFQTARLFRHVAVCLYRPGTFSTRLVRRLRMLSLSRFRPASVWLWRPACGPIDRSRRGKISVKCQIAKYIWNFCEKGECGALATIYLVRFSRLGGPDVL